MTKFLENKQVIHIVSEIVVIVSVIVYFNQKHKKLLKQIEDLVQRVEDQEDLIQKHEQVIQKLLAYVNNQIQPQPMYNIAKPVMPVPAPRENGKASIVATGANNKPRSNPPRVRKPASVPVPAPPAEVVMNSDNEESENETDLDAEIEQELAELHAQDTVQGVDERVNISDHVGKSSQRQSIKT